MKPLLGCCCSIDAVVQTNQVGQNDELVEVSDDRTEDKEDGMTLSADENASDSEVSAYASDDGSANIEKTTTCKVIPAENIISIQDRRHMSLPIPTDSLTDTLGFLPSTELSRLLPFSRELHKAGTTILHDVLANELRPKLPVSFVEEMDKSNWNKKEYWIKFAREFRQKKFVRAGKCAICAADPADSDGDADSDADIDSDDDEDDLEGDAQTPTTKATAPCDDLLVAFLSKPFVRELLVDDCDPAEFAEWLRENTEDFRALGDIRRELAIFASKIFVEGELHYDEEDGEEDDPYNVLTKTGGVEGVGVRPDWYTFGCFARAVMDHSPTEHHYLMIEITSRGGRPLYLDDDTPLVMWIDGEGKPVSPVKSAMSFGDENQAIARPLSDKIAPRCTCPTCNRIITPVLTDHALLSSDLLLLEEPWMADKFRGCEEQCYGRMIIEEDTSDPDGISFLPCRGFPGNEQDEQDEASIDDAVDPCGLPDADSMDNFFEITMKTVHFDRIQGPSSVTIWKQRPLFLYGSNIITEGDDAGLVKHMFMSQVVEEKADPIQVQLQITNCAKLAHFSSPHDFACDPRPSSNQMWIKSFDVALVKIDYDAREGDIMPRSDLFAYCGLLDGF